MNGNVPEMQSPMAPGKGGRRLGFGGVVPLARRMIAHDRLRVGITVAGVGAAVILMLFLLALYDGVRSESNGYVTGRPVDAWVAQGNTTNFIKSQSLIPLRLADTLRTVSGVAEVSPLLRLITVFEVGSSRISAIVVGFDSHSLAGRPTVVAGSDRLERGGIILDQVLARRFGIGIGDSLRAEERTFHVTGLSRGTNILLTQLAFITQEDAGELLGFPGVTSFLLVRGAPGVVGSVLVQRLSERLPRMAVLSQEEFAANNMEELRGGLLPILATVAVLGGLDAVAMLALMLYGSVLERREDYAVLKAIGASERVLAILVVRQSLAAVGGGLVFGVVSYYASAPVVLRIVPEMLLALSLPALIAVAAGALVTGLLGALWPLRRISRIHPAEVFRA